MSKDPELADWLTSMGVSQQFASQDIESGRTVASIIRAISKDSKIQLQEGNSAIVRVSNWNSIAQSLKVLGIRLSQEEKSKIINGNHDLVFNVISKLRQLHQKSAKETEINLKDIDPKKDVKDADSLLELFLLAIVKHFALAPKEALSLLSNDCKYLAHILAKGLKGDFRPIDALILEFSKNLQKIINFSKNRENEQFFLKAVKPSLISKSQSVADNTLNLLFSYLQSYDVENRIKLIKQHLIPTLMLVMRRHPQFTDRVVQSITIAADFSPTVINDMYQHTSKSDATILFLALWKSYSLAGKQKIIQSSSMFSKLMDHVKDGIIDPSGTLRSLDCCLQLADTEFDTFDRYCGESLVNSVRQIVLSKESDNLELVHKYFALLSLTGDRKHPLAPILYKLLAARLTQAGTNQYDVLVQGFCQILEEIPSIPPATLIEALSQRSDLKIQQLQLSLFLKMLVGGAEARVGVVIYNLVSRTFVEETGMGRQLANLLLQIVEVFREQEILIDMTGKLVKVCLALYYAGAKRTSEKRKPLSHKSKLQGEEATNKLKMLQIEYFLKKVIELEEKDITAAAEPLLCFSCLQLAALGKEHARGLEKIVALLGDPSKLLAKYEKELGGSLDASQNKSRIRQQSPSSKQIEHSPQAEDTSENVSNFIKSAERKAASAHPLHPMSLSLVAVKHDACLGMEKYTKLYQKKMLAEQSKRYQALMVEQQKQKQKKVYEKKIALERGLRLKGVSQKELTYLFQFNTKDIYAESNHLYLNCYTPEAEEQRDAQGVQQFVRRYDKIMKLYFNLYSGKKQGFHTKLFDEISDRANFVHSSGVYKMLKEHGLESFITPKEVQFLARKVNYKMNSVKDDAQLLDFQGFKEMMVQISFTMYTRPPKDLRGKPVAEMLDELFSTFKLYASENRVNPQLFDEPQTCYTGEAEAIRLLNRRLQQNPDYILPEGYKKITQNRVYFDHKIYLQALSPIHKEVYEVLDEILFEALKFHIIEPFTQELKICRARPNVYALDLVKLAEVEQKHLPIFLKKEVAKFPMKERTIAKEAALVLADIQHAVELNHDEIGLKHENPIIKSKRQKQEELRRAREAADAKRLNATRQLRSAMETQKEAREQKMKKKEEQREEQLRKKREEKQKRQRRQKDLKQKLEEYNQKKKEEDEAKKAGQQAKLQKQRQLAEKKRKELEQTKRKIDQLKKQKETEQKERKEREKEEQKRRKQQERKKLERSQIEKKQMIEQYKSKKKGETTKVIDAPAEEEQNA